MGNPLMEMSGDLIVLDSKTVADYAIVDSINKIIKVGQVNVIAYFRTA